MLCDEVSNDMFTGLRYYYLNFYSGSSLREAFIICRNFHCNPYKNEESKSGTRSN